MRAARPVLLRSDYHDPGVAEVAFCAEADGIVNKTSLVTDLLVAVDTLLAGGRFVSPPAAA